MTKRYFSKTRRKRMYKRRGGGEDEYDIEQGPVIPVVPLKRIPTDPVKRQQEIGRAITKGISPAEAELVFSGPNPEEKQKLERSEMGKHDKEDPDVATYTFSDLNLFSEGGRKKTRRHRRKTSKSRRARKKTKKHNKK
jgi:hypothetical protein